MDPADRAHPELVRALDAQATQFETPCGSGRMVWRRWGAGDPVVLFHGGSGSWLHWLRTLPALTRRYTVWVPDMPGFGDSDLPPEPFTLEHYVEPVREGLTRLLPEERFHAVGFSLGASIAARIALLLPGRVRRIVLSGANFIPTTGRTFPLVSVKRAADAAAREQAVRHNIQVMMLAHERSIDSLALYLYGRDTARRQLPRVSFSGFHRLREDLPLLQIDGLAVISGADDQVIGHDSPAQEGALASVRPDADYRILPGAGHWVMYEAAERYNEALLSALSGA